MTTFADVLAGIESIEGWLRPEQARVLWDAALEVPPGGQIVEIGSFRGKSTIVLASAAAPGVAVHAIDPHAGNDRAPGEWVGAAEDGEADFELFTLNLTDAGLAERVNHVRQFSQEPHAQDAISGSVDLLFVDGAHGYRPARSDIVEWGGRVRPGGTMTIHDVFGSAFLTLAVARSLFWSSGWRYLGRERTLAIYRREDMTAGARLGSLASQLACLPWFARNLVIKALERTGLAPATRLLGHTPGSGVY